MLKFILTLWSSMALSSLGQEYGELGTINDLNHIPQRVELDQSYVHPVVFLSPLSFHGTQPAIARISDMQNNNGTWDFKVDVKEPSCYDQRHAKENANYMVFEQGQYLLDGRIPVLVNTTKMPANSVLEIFLPPGLFDNPIILTEIQNVPQKDDKNTFTVVIDQSSKEKFSIIITPEEGAVTQNELFEVAWLAVETSSDNVKDTVKQNNSGTFLVDKKEMAQKDQVKFKEHSAKFSINPFVFAQIQSFKGKDPVLLRMKKVNKKTVALIMAEENCGDKENTHTKEIIGFFVLQASTLFLEPCDVDVCKKIGAISEQNPGDALVVEPDTDPDTDDSSKTDADTDTPQPSTTVEQQNSNNNNDNNHTENKKKHHSVLLGLFLTFLVLNVIVVGGVFYLRTRHPSKYQSLMGRIGRLRLSNNRALSVTADYLPAPNSDDDDDADATLLPL